MVHLRRSIYLAYVFFLHGRLAGLLVNFFCHKLGIIKLSFKPTFVQIEPTSICDLSCELCPVGQGAFKRAHGRMALNTFKDFVLDNDRSLAFIVLYNIGEPFLNPETFDMIRVAVSRKIFVKVSTNGVFESEGIIDKILDSGLDEIVVSLDFADREIYKKFKKKDVFDRVVRHIRGLVLKRGKRKKPFIAVQFLMTRDNEARQDAIAALFLETGADKLIIKKVRLDGYDQGRDREVLPLDSRFVRDYYLPGHRVKANACPRPWVSVDILWDGTVVPCCFDINGDHPVGNIRYESLGQLWNGERMKDFRSKLLSHSTPLKMCRHCSGRRIRGNFTKLH